MYGFAALQSRCHSAVPLSPQQSLDQSTQQVTRHRSPAAILPSPANQTSSQENHLMLATVESKNQAVSKLEALIERGRSRAANVIDHVMRNQPTDRLARGEALQFRAADNLPDILMTVPDREHGTIEQSLHRNAVYQMAQATDMPVKFIDSLQSVAEPWGRQLLAHNLQTVFNRR